MYNNLRQSGEIFSDLSLSTSCIADTKKGGILSRWKLFMALDLAEAGNTSDRNCPLPPKRPTNSAVLRPVFVIMVYVVSGKTKPEVTR